MVAFHNWYPYWYYFVLKIQLSKIKLRFRVGYSLLKKVFPYFSPLIFTIEFEVTYFNSKISK